MREKVLVKALVMIVLSSACAESKGEPNSAVRSPAASKLNQNRIAASDGPFGLDSGLAETQLESLAEFSNADSLGMVFSSKGVPKPHPDFEAYWFILSPTSGLCRVRGTGKGIENDAYGSQIKASFASLAEALTTKYGPSKKFDFLNAGSIWHESNEWMMALRQNERTLAAVWPKDSGSLPYRLSEIVLQAHATSSSDGYITLTYSFNNSASCLAELAKQKNSAL